MGLLSKLKSVLGLDSDGDDRGGRRTDDVGVTVERERDEADAANEAAVKGVDENDDAESEPDDATEDGTELEEEPELEDETESENEPEPEDESAAEAETEADAEADEGGAEADEGDAEADEGDVDTEAGEVEEADTGDAEADAEDGEESASDAGGDLQDIKGIGPAYADRLSEVGIESIAELADADFEAVAEEAGLAPGRVEQWVDRANARQ